jgi:hypothetical protein
MNAAPRQNRKFEISTFASASSRSPVKAESGGENYHRWNRNFYRIFTTKAF